MGTLSGDFGPNYDDDTLREAWRVTMSWQDLSAIGLLPQDEREGDAAALVGLRNEDGTPLVQNCTLTCFTNEEEREVGLDEVMPFLLATRLEELGAKLDLADKFVSHAVADGRLITGQNPQSSQAVADAMVAALYRE